MLACTGIAILNIPINLKEFVKLKEILWQIIRELNNVIRK